MASTTVTKLVIERIRSSSKKKRERARRPRSARLAWSGRGNEGRKLDGRSTRTSGPLVLEPIKLRWIGSRRCLWKFVNKELQRRSKMSSIGWTRRLRELCTRRCSVSRLLLSRMLV